MTKTLYWTRHAPVFRRHDEIVGSGTDRDLNNEGIEKAHALARGLSHAAIRGTLKDLSGVIVSSSLLRAVSTSEIVANVLGFEVRLEDDLRAQHFGELEGMLKSEVDEEPRLSAHLHKNLLPEDLYSDRTPGGESIEDVFKRMDKARRRLFIGEEGNPLVITHGSVLNMVIGSVQGLTVPQWTDISTGYKGMVIGDSGDSISGIELPEPPLITPPR